MAMPDLPRRSVALSLPPEEQWTLHHVLLDRIEREARAEDAATVSPPSVEVYEAFETLDAGETSFTVVQLDAIRTLLAEYHHVPSWELDRSRVERLIHRITVAIEGHGTACPAE